MLFFFIPIIKLFLVLLDLRDILSVLLYLQ
jgi:hypothetical protein